MKSKKYWQQRFEQLEDASHSYGIATYREIEPAFDKAQREIQKEIEAWYGRFADNNEVSIQEARKMLSASELKEFQWDVKEYIRYGQENAVDGLWVKELENASARVHISRLEALKIRTQQAAEVAFGNEVDEVDKMASKVYTDSYYHSIFEVQKAFGVGWDIGQIDERKLQKIISKPWAADGRNFSDRIWQSRTQLVNELYTELTRACILGKAPDQAIKNIASKFNVSKNQAGRLVMTEQAYFHSVAQEEAFKELDVEEYEILATLDSHTSAICRSLDGEVFPMKEYSPGSTAPPFHPYCRSVTIPHFDDNYGGERAAKDENGNTYYVPDTMKYNEWENKYVKPSIKATLKPNNNGGIINNKPKVIHTTSEVKTALVNDVGFDDVESSFALVDDDLAIENTNQLLKLENKFGVVHKSTGTISSQYSKGTEAYVSSRVTTPSSQNLVLCSNAYSDRVAHITTLINQRKSGYCMPFLDSEAGIYDVTHEYGHMLQNLLVQERMISKGWTKSNPRQFINASRRTRKAQFKWYYDITKEVEQECYSEIIAIARKNNPNFKLSDNISQYGKSKYCEFFAEVFANSQLGNPNELGIAMQEWLEQRGLVLI